MIGKYSVLSLAVLAWHGPLAAQRAELIHFDGPVQNVVINVGSRPVAPATAEDRVPVGLSHTLASDFAQIGEPPAVEMPSLTAPITVPQWMRTGVPSARFDLRPSPPGPPLGSVNCAGARYHPRVDLPPSTEFRRAQLFPLIAAIACEHQIPVGLFDALIGQESRYQHGALSPKGAIGLAQLMPGTADYLGVANPWDVVENLRGGARYLRMQIDEFGRYDLALAAYNAGPGRVRTHGRIPRIRETLEYVRNITAVWAITERRQTGVFGSQASSLRMGSQGSASVASYTSTSVANPR